MLCRDAAKVCVQHCNRCADVLQPDLYLMEGRSRSASGGRWTTQGAWTIATTPYELQEHVETAMLVEQQVIWQLHRDFAGGCLFKIWVPSKGCWLFYPVSEQFRVRAQEPSPIGRRVKCLVLKAGRDTYLLDFPTRAPAAHCLAAYEVCLKNDANCSWEGPEVETTPELVWRMDLYQSQVARAGSDQPRSAKGGQALVDTYGLAFAAVLVGAICACGAKMLR